MVEQRDKQQPVVLLSGGLDSAVCLALAGYSSCLLVNYGQPHWPQERKAAGEIASKVGGALYVATVDWWHKINRHDPAMFVPGRNMILLSIAAAMGKRIMFGANADDHDGYPDCRPEYLEAFERMSHLATKAAVEGQKLAIHAPLIRMTKAEIIRCGIELGVDYSLTSSCYDPSPEGRPCGQCDSCQLRAKGFAEAGVPDPLLGG